jgi:hypothetical protein
VSDTEAAATHIVVGRDTPGRYVMLIDDPELAWRHVIEVEAPHTEAAAALAAKLAIEKEIADGSPADIPADALSTNFVEGTALYAEPLADWIVRVGGRP